MKILYIINNLTSGGAEKLLFEMLEKLSREKKHELELLILEKNINDRYYTKISQMKVKIHISKFNKIRKISNVFVIKKLIDKNNYDVVHGHLFPTLYYLSIVKLIYKMLHRFHKTQFIFTEHSSHNRRREITYFRVIENVIYNQYDAVVSISIHVQNALQQWIKLYNDKCHIVNNGICIDKYYPTVRNGTNQVINLAMIGRFTESKDQETIIKTLALLPKNVVLYLVGEGELKPYIQECIKNLELSDRVFLIGFTDDIPNFLSTMDIYIQSSRWEGFGLSIIEAMASGLPVIVSNVPGLYDILENSVLYFEVGNVKSLISKIELLIEDNEQFSHYSISSLNHCKKFDISNMVSSYIRLYNSLIVMKSKKNYRGE